MDPRSRGLVKGRLETAYIRDFTHLCGFKTLNFSLVHLRGLPFRKPQSVYVCVAAYSCKEASYTQCAAGNSIRFFGK